MRCDDRTTTRRWLATVLATAFVVGCQGGESGEGWPVGAQTDAETRASSDADAGDASSCEMGAWNFNCVTVCISDNSRAPVCENGEWVCPEGTQKISSCPDDACIQPWQDFDCVSSCDDESPDSPSCPNRGDAECPDGTFPRTRHCEETCKVEAASDNIDGVDIRFPGTCRWSVERMREGVQIPYEVVVDEPIEGVVPEPTDAGGCERSGDSGLIPSATIHGDGQKWCRCDVGNCPEPELEPRRLEPGTYRQTIEWEGRNWEGPSDTGREKGEYFPPGTYEVTVTAKGERELSDGGTKSFELEASMEIRLIE